ncbi:adenine phosphoribosyltransferase [Jatrophihabitans sp. YIM 134969]
MTDPSSSSPDAAAPTGDAGPAIAKIVADGMRDVPDYPKEGVLFKDIVPLLVDADAFGATIAALAQIVKAAHGDEPVDLVAGIEARGFIVAAALARELKCGLLPLRKAGKLPPPVISETYDLEYGTATIETSTGVIDGRSVYLVDDVLATGGTLVAASKLVSGAGGTLVGVGVLLELGFLGGRAKLAEAVAADLPLAALLAV